MLLTTPPIGMAIFVVLGLGEPYGISYGDVVKGALPYLLCDAMVVALAIAFPIIVLWLPHTIL